MAAADGYPELGLDGLCNIPVGAALAEADGGDPVAGDLEFKVGVGAAVSRTGYPEAVSGDPDVGQDSQLVQAGVWVVQVGWYAPCAGGHLSLFSATLGANPALVGEYPS